MVYSLLSLVVCCTLWTSKSLAEEQLEDDSQGSWWNSLPVFRDLPRRTLRGEKDGFWAVRGKRSPVPSSERPLLADNYAVEDDDVLNYLVFLKEFLRDASELEGLAEPGQSKRNILKPNGLFGAYGSGKRTVVKPNGLFAPLPGKRAGGLKPNGLFGGMGKRSFSKPNGLFSLGGKRTSLKPNGLFNVHGKRSLSLKPNGFFTLDKRIFKPNGLFAAFKRSLKPNGLFAFKRSAAADLEDMVYNDDAEEMEEEWLDEDVQPMMDKKDDKNFWAVRGKKADDFWAVRGKKAADTNDFWAVRGKRDAETTDTAAAGAANTAAAKAEEAD